MAPREGANVNGLYLEGARWDNLINSLAGSRPKELYFELPVIHIRATTKDKQELRNVYECPVYRTRYEKFYLIYPHLHDNEHFHFAFLAHRTDNGPTHTCGHSTSRLERNNRNGFWPVLRFYCSLEQCSLSSSYTLSRREDIESIPNRRKTVTIYCSFQFVCRQKMRQTADTNTTCHRQTAFNSKFFGPHFLESVIARPLRATREPIKSGCLNLLMIKWLFDGFLFPFKLVGWFITCNALD